MEMVEKTTPPKSYAPWYFVGFFVLLAIMDGIFVTIATRTHTGVVTDDAYNEGLAYNETIKAAEAQAALGWKGDILYEDGKLSLTLNDANATPINGAIVRAEVTRPIDAELAWSVKLAETDVGHYTGKIEIPQNGQWDVRVFAEWNQQKYQMRERLILR